MTLHNPTRGGSPRTVAVAAVALLTVLAGVPAGAVAQSGGVAVDGLDPTSTTVTKGETATVSADAENTGSSETTATLELVTAPGTAEETVLATKSVALDGEETETVTFSGVDVDLDPGTYDYVVRSDDDSSAVGAMTVREPATFEVEVDDARTDAEVSAGATATVGATVTNAGDVTETKAVELEVDGVAVNATDLTLSGGESAPVSFDYATDESDAPSVDAAVTTADDVDSRRIDVLAPSYDVEIADATTEDVVGGENVTLVAEVTNVGDAAGNETVTFAVGDQTATEPVALEPDESETVEVSTFATSGADAPALDASVSVGEAEATTTVTVREPATFEVEITDEWFDGEAATVAATVSNAGGVDGTGTVAFEVDGAAVATETVTLDADERGTVEFSHEFAPDTSSIDATVRTEDDFETTTIARANVDEGPTIEGVAPAKTDGGDPVTVTYTAAGDRVSEVRLLVEGPDGEIRYDRAVEAGESRKQAIPASVTEAGEGDYEVTLRAADRSERTVVDRDGFTVDATFGTERVAFERDAFGGPAGDLVEIQLSVEPGTDTYVLVGGDRTTDGRLNNYLDLLYVRSDGDGRVTITVNTRLVGTDVASERVYAGGSDTVVSYAQEYGAGTDPEETEEFESAAFVDGEGDEVATTLAGLREAVEITPLPRPVQPARYRLVAGADDTVVLREDSRTPDMANPLARSNLLLTDPEIANVTTHVLPRASADELVYGDDNDERLTGGNLDRLLDSATRRNTVAAGDRLVVEVEATGLYGALLASTGQTADFEDETATEPVIDGGVGPAVLADLLGYHEGVELEIEESNADPNHEPTRLRLSGASPGDVFLIPDADGAGDGAAIDRFYVVIDTRETSPFTAALEGGDRFEAEFAYESPDGEHYDFGSDAPPAPFDPASEPTEAGVEHYPYLGAEQTTEAAATSFAVEEPRVTYDRTAVGGDDVVVVAGGPSATISGRTNVAPGSSVTIQIVSEERQPPAVATVDDVTIEPDGTFEATADLSSLDAGADVDVEFYAYQQPIDKRPAVLVDPGEDPVSFEVAALTERVTTTRGEPVGTVSATIRNAGTLDGRETVEFRLDGETVAERDLLVQRGESQVVDFDGPIADLEPGEYRYTVVTPHDEATGTLVVESGSRSTAAATGTPAGPTNEPASQAYEAESGAPEERDGPEERIPERGFPGVPLVGVRDALGGLAVVGSVYVLGAAV